MRILFEDNHLLVVMKPAGTPVQADESGDLDLLTKAKAYVKQKYRKPGDVYLGLVHRLDRPVSGVLVLARTSKAASRLSAQFRAHTPAKRYLALVEGKLYGAGTEIDYLAKRNRHVRRVKPTYPGAKRAELDWISRAWGKRNSLIEVTLKTGRPHQIRVQLAKLKHSILGDLRYGASGPFDGRNLALHCFALTIEHPTKKELMTFTAMPPVTWNGFFGKDVRTIVDDARR